MTLTIGELCAGYGGLSMAIEEVFTARPAWFSEFDPAPSKILAHHWPHVPNLGDMTQIDWAAVEPVDIISGGTPCQDLSHAGKRAGMTEGTRSNLWVQMREAIATIRPRYVVWENVRGAYSAAADSEVEPCPGCVGNGSGVNLRALGRVLGDLSDLGYDCAWHGLTAASIGAPHGRFRVFVLAWVTADAIGGGRDGWALDEIWGEVERVAATGSGQDFVADTNGHALRLEPVTITGGGGAAESGHAVQWGPLTDTDREAGRPEQPRGIAPRPPEGTVLEARWGTGRDSDPHTQWGQYAPAIKRWEGVLGRPAPAPTEPSIKGNPRLSPRFVEWMQGLPAGHVTDPAIGISRNEQLKALGNGVLPAQAAAALRYLLAATEGVRSRMTTTTEAAERVAEFLRQWALMRDKVDRIYGVHADVNADMADLLASDLYELLANQR